MALDVKFLVSEIKEQYLDQGEQPWIVGFSGGKDSTMLLQLVWTALKEIPAEDRKRHVYVICNNTLVENPIILEYVDDVLKKIEEAAFAQELPITVDQTTPRLEDSFWVNMIGKGYPAPNNVFRWCTERLKINPTTRYILEKINSHGEAIILLGTRSDESATRAKSMKRHEIKGSRLRAHPLPNAHAFTPIKDVITDEVWQYLLQVNSPWGASNKKLVNLYRNASGGDCPLITDIKTPSCGQSRFGCWVCTVVRKDASMEGLIEYGEEWMEPLLEIREYLMMSRDAHKEGDDNYRMKVRRNGAAGIGPYYPEIRKHILTSILKAQKVIQDEQPRTNLITHQELVAIQVLWYRDNIFDFNVAEIYNEIFEQELDLSQLDENLIREKELLKEVCKDNPEDFSLINDLLSLQKSRIILMNKYGLQKDMEKKLERFLAKS
ncbi:MAG: DNA phosphorothioation system sulfurtransferase DndC [Bacteroidota bacterium]